MNKKVAVIISFLVAIAAVALIYLYLNRMKKDVYKGMERVTILVAGGNLRAGSKLDARNLAFYEFPSKFVGRRCIMQAEGTSVIGATLLNNIELGKPILWSDIKEKALSGQMTLADMIEPGMRAVTIPVSGSAALAGMLHPMQRIDLLFTFQMSDFAQKPKQSLVVGDQPVNIESLKKQVIQNAMQRGNSKGRYTATLMQDMLIIAVGDKTSMGGIVDNSKAKTPGSGGSSYSSITLMATPEQAKMLTFCQGEGKFNVVLRRTGDNSSPTPNSMISFPQTLDYMEALVNQPDQN